MKKLLTLAAAAVASLGMAATAQAQYPSGPVQFIVPWPPGDFEDILTRMIAAEMADRTGVGASVVNRPGGGDGPFPGALEVLAALLTVRSSVPSSSVCRWLVLTSTSALRKTASSPWASS